jgi:hypothetical protein
VDDSGFLRIPDRLLMLSGSRAQQSEVIEIITGARGPYNLGSFATEPQDEGGRRNCALSSTARSACTPTAWSARSTQGQGLRGVVLGPGSECSALENC